MGITSETRNKDSCSKFLGEGISQVLTRALLIESVVIHYKEQVGCKRKVEISFGKNNFGDLVVLIRFVHLFTSSYDKEVEL